MDAEGPRPLPEPSAVASGSTRRTGSAYLPTAVFIFFLVNAVCATDRVVLSVLVTPIKAELTLTDSQVGLLSFAGAIFYALFGIVTGRLTDVWSRRRLLALSVGLFGAATAACGAAASFIQLFIARIGVGVGEAGAVPSKYSMVGDMFHPEHRASVLALVQAGVGVGATASVLIAGVLADRIGWRSTFIWMGVPGILLMLIAWSVLRDPVRGTFEVAKQDREATPGLLETLSTLCHNRTFLCIVFAYALTTFGLFGLGYWLPSFLVRTHDLSLTQVGVAYGAVNGAGFLVGLLIGAAISMRLLRYDRRWEMWLPGLVNVGVMVTNFVAFASSSLTTTLGFLGLSAVLLGLTSGPASAAIQSTVPARMRGVAVSMTMFMSALIGQGIAPWLIGVSSDAFAQLYGDDSLRIAMMASTGIFALGALLYGLGGRSFHRDRVD